MLDQGEKFEQLVELTRRILIAAIEGIIWVAVLVGATMLSPWAGAAVAMAMIVSIGIRVFSKKKRKIAIAILMVALLVGVIRAAPMFASQIGEFAQQKEAERTIASAAAVEKQKAASEART